MQSCEFYRFMSVVKCPKSDVELFAGYAPPTWHLLWSVQPQSILKQCVTCAWSPAYREPLVLLKRWFLNVTRHAIKQFVWEFCWATCIQGHLDTDMDGYLTTPCSRRTLKVPRKHNILMGAPCLPEVRCAPLQCLTLSTQTTWTLVKPLVDCEYGVSNFIVVPMITQLPGW